MNAKISAILLFLLVFVVACSNIDISKLSDEDLRRLSENAVLCNKPYMRVGAECCLDKDGNGICDKDEREGSEPVDRDASDTTAPILDGDRLVCNKPYIQVGTECCLDQNANAICDYDDEYYAEEEPTAEEEPEEETEEETEFEEEAAPTCEDNEKLYEECETGKPGECKVGEYDCVDDVFTCVAPEPEEEWCDGLDNDCDGAVDNGNPEGGDECTDDYDREGTYQCQGGELICSTRQTTSTELCNGVDDNRDGAVDETYPQKGERCSVGVGACSNAGTYTCSRDGTELVCSVQAKTPTEEKCNGIDDDCDGQWDENNPEGGAACTISGSAGLTACRNGVIVCIKQEGATSTGSSTGTSTKELCNGRDDDGDGESDEDFTSKNWYCEIGRGPCRSTGVYVCKADGSDVECNAPVLDVSKPEVCDGQDNDCDGSVDNGNPGGGGECSYEGHPGENLCKDGRVQCIYRYEEEQCNGIDDDKDGQVDEDLTGTWCQRQGGWMGWYTYNGFYVCRNGIWVCNA